MLQKVSEYAMADLEINSVQEMVAAAKWGQEVLERAYRGPMAGQAELSPVRLLTELRAVIPQQHWPEFVRRLSAGKRGLPPAVVERVEEGPPGEPLGSPRPERPDHLEAADRSALPLRSCGEHLRQPPHIAENNRVEPSVETRLADEVDTAAP